MTGSHGTPGGALEPDLFLRSEIEIMSCHHATSTLNEEKNNVKKIILDTHSLFMLETGFMNKNLLPRRLKKIRKKLDWSRERLAAELGVSHQTVYRWERGALPGRPSRQFVFERLAGIERR